MATYEKDFKAEAVQLSDDIGVKQAAAQLGIPYVVQAQSGAIRMDAMFIDEGFGTLDDNALRNSLRVLSSLADGKRLIGIISHVHDLEERIDRQIYVTKGLKGSRIEIRV